MKELTAFLLITVLTVHISGYFIKVPTAPVQQVITSAPIQQLRNQKLIVSLFENVCDECSDPDIRTLAQNYTPIPEEYQETEVVKKLQVLISRGLLPKGEIFSEYNTEHMNELKIIYEVLYNAKHFDTFLKAAAWGRQNLNCALFINALYLSMQIRNDTSRITIPAPYEIIPNYFVRKDVLVTATSILKGETAPTEGVRDEGDTFFIDANYTGIFFDNDDESKLAYFREDIGLNSYYFFKKLSLAPWFNRDMNSKYGENLYQMMKELSSRYDLERYANGLPEVDTVNWDSLVDVPYDPLLIYSDGEEFSHRSSPLQLPVNEELELLKTMENSVSSFVSHMRQNGYNKSQILNHLMDILVTGERSYETLARQFLGKDIINNGAASVLEHYMTTLRDPMFWKLNKKIVELVDNALKLLPPYSRNELYFPGVEVVNVDVKKMMTMYDYFSFDVTDALKLTDNTTYKIKIGQPRLNHKPFTIKINVSSLVTQKGLAKVFIGPKLLPGELATKKNLFILLDQFEVNLKPGSNILTRSSEKTNYFANDFMSLPTIRRRLDDAEFGVNSTIFNTVEEQTSYPARLILPKGSSQGITYQMFVFVAPFVKASLNNSYYTNIMELNTAVLSPGYPLDLLIEDRLLLGLPNAMIKLFNVSQKGDSKIENYGGPGVTKKWYSYSDSEYDPTLRSNYSNQYKQPFDYKSKINANGYVDYQNRDKINEYNAARDNTINGKDNNDELSVMALDDSEYRTKPGVILQDSERNQSSPKDTITNIKYFYDVTDPMPRLLSSTGIKDFTKPQRKETFDYKSKNSDVEQKRKDLKKYHKITVNSESTTFSATPINEQKEQDILSNEIYNPNKITDMPYYLLKTSKLDFATNKQDNFKSEQFKKKYAKNKSEYVLPVLDGELIDTIEDLNASMENRFPKEIVNPDVAFTKVNSKNLVSNDYLQERSTTKPSPTVYDYLYKILSS